MLLAQDGHQASERIHEGISKGYLSGAVLSTLFRKSATIKDAVIGLHKLKNDALVILDNEFYINAIVGAEKMGKFSDYPYYSHPLTKKDLASPFTLAEYIKKTVDYQLDVAGLKHITAPGVIIESFEHASEAICLSLLSGTCEYIAKQRPGDVESLYATLVINEQALLSTDTLPAFLDELTGLDNLKGFYVVIDKTTSPLSYWSNPATLATMMYITRALHENGYEVIIGYADIPDLLNLTVGATAIATGWWDNTSSFTQKKFMNGGGRRSKKYYSSQLLNSIYIDPELQSIKSLGFIERITQGNDFDSELANDPYDTAWPDSTAILHKWQAMKVIVAKIDNASDEQEKIQILESYIDSSLELYGEFNSAGLKFQPHTGSRKITAMKQAIAIYRNGVL